VCVVGQDGCQRVCPHLRELPLLALDGGREGGEGADVVLAAVVDEGDALIVGRQVEGEEKLVEVLAVGQLLLDAHH
jgi:hypothetical protein